MSDNQVCGTGAACERTCPLMRAGRDCPTLPEFIREVLAQESQQLEPQPA